MKINISEAKGELSFGVVWISADGRLMTKWYHKYLLAKKHHVWLKQLGRQPTIYVRIYP